MRASALAPALSLPLFAMAIFAVAAYSPRAEACGAIPPLYVTLDRVLPAAGTTAVALDGAVLVDATGWYGSAQFDASYDLPPLLQVAVTVRGTQAPVAGTVTPWTDGRAIFRPTTPLAPSTTYDVLATVTNTQTKPAGNAGITTSSTNFTTGTSLLAPLAFGATPPSPSKTWTTRCVIRRP